MDASFARLPSPPYYAVIFSSRRNGHDDAGYAEAAQRMVELAAQQPGYLGVESTRDADGFYTYGNLPVHNRPAGAGGASPRNVLP